MMRDPPKYHERLDKAMFNLQIGSIMEYQTRKKMVLSDWQTVGLRRFMSQCLTPAE